jgi:membrane fusion protein (multidrug efflux system)
MGKKFAIGLIIILLCLNVLFGFYIAKRLHKDTTKESTKKDIVVSVQKPQGEKVVITSNYIGVVQAVNHTQIVPYISGYVIKIEAKGGQKVKKGDILAILKQEQYLAELSAADAALFAARAEFANSKIHYYRLLNAGDKAVSLTEIDDGKTAYMNAKGKLKQAHAAYQNAVLNFKYTYLTAPFDGVLGDVALSLGDYISPQSKDLMKLVQYNPIRVVFSITDKEYLKGFKDDKKIQIRLRLSDGTLYPEIGQIKYSANEVDKNTSSVAVYAEFANSEGKLLPNAYVNVLVLKEYEDVILLPKEQVIMKNDGYFVLTVQNGVLEEKQVEIIGEINNEYAIKNIFAKDEFIAYDALQSEVGQKVKTEFSLAEK